MTPLTKIPGIGKTFVEDFKRIGITTVEQLQGKKPGSLYLQLHEINKLDNHKTSKLYLYVIRMAVYYANGGRDEEKLKWNYWKD